MATFRELSKLTGDPLFVAEHSYERISTIAAGYSERFHDRFADYRIASLQQFVELLSQWPDVQCFIELKQASLDNFGNRAVDLVLQQMQRIPRQGILISFNYDALMYARQQHDRLPIGWVLPEWNEENHQRAIDLNPDYLHVSRKICPDQKSEIWPGPWQWAAYTINQAHEIAHFAALAIELLETDRYSELKKESKLIDIGRGGLPRCQ